MVVENPLNSTSENWGVLAVRVTNRKNIARTLPSGYLT